MKFPVRHLAYLLEVALCALAHGQAPLNLFKPVIAFGPIDPKVLSGGINVARFRVVQTETSLINRAAAASAQRATPRSFGPNTPESDRPTLKVVNLNLFDDISYVVDLKDAVISADERTTTWSGLIRGASQSSVTLAVTGRVVFGNVTTAAGALYEIRPIGGADSATQAILQVEAASFPRESTPIPVQGSGIAQDINPDAKPALINVLVAYTQAAAKVGGSADGVTALAGTAESETNHGYLNSGVKQSIRVVGLLPVTYDERGGYALALQRLADPHDNYMDEVHTTRAKLHADMVLLLISNAQSCGLSYLAQPPTAQFASKAFSVVNIGCATGNFSFGHELGHLQGCNHDRADADGPGAFPYSYGYQQTGKDPHFRDIMSYDCVSGCARINYWSNPNILYKGLPVGDSSAQNQTNNALTLNRTQYIASGWRP